MSFCSKLPSDDRSLLSYSRDESFVRIIKENVTDPLIKGHFQSTPSLEAFIQVVLDTERLVNVGKITSIHDLEVVLICAARV